MSTLTKQLIVLQQQINALKLVYANDGLSVTNGVTKLGQVFATVGDPAKLITDREIPLDGKVLKFKCEDYGTGNIEIGQTHTVYIDGWGYRARPKVGITEWTDIPQAGNSDIKGVRYDSFLLNVDRRNVIVDNNTNLYFCKGSALIRGYYKPDAVFSMSINGDYQHNNFSTTFGGGFITKTGIPASTIVAGVAWNTSVTVNFHKYLLNGSGQFDISGYLSNTRYLFEVENSGTQQNYADIVAGGIKRLSLGVSYTIVNKIALYVVPIKDAFITNAYGIYQEGTDDKNYFGGRIGIGTLTQSAYLHIKAGTTVAGTAPIKLTTDGAALLATPEPGAFETDGTDLFFTNNAGVRKTVTLV